jgi:hypothetical protein
MRSRGFLAWALVSLGASAVRGADVPPAPTFPGWPSTSALASPNTRSWRACFGQTVGLELHVTLRARRSWF